MSHLLETKRATRGQRMSELVGEAKDEDNAFYGAEIWEDGDEEENKSFGSEDDESVPDEFDSDFNESEDDEEATAIVEGDSSKKGQKRARELEREDRTSKKNVYKEPTRLKLKSNSSSSSKPIKEPRKMIVHDPSEAIARMVRQSTKTKTGEAEKVRKVQEAVSAKRAKPKPVIKHKFTQKELLLEGLDTEGENIKWLLQQKRNAQAMGEEKAYKDSNAHESVKKWISRRGTNDIISFTEVDDVPEILKLTEDDRPISLPKKCYIRGKPAKYMDPLTGVPYADKDAFKELRARHARKQIGSKKPVQQVPVQQQQQQQTSVPPRHSMNHPNQDHADPQSHQSRLQEQIFLQAQQQQQMQMQQQQQQIQMQQQQMQIQMQQQKMVQLQQQQRQQQQKPATSSSSSTNSSAPTLGGNAINGVKLMRNGVAVTKF